MISNDTLQRLHDLLLGEDETPLYDGAGVITTKGGDAKIRAQAIKECIRIVEQEQPKL